MSKRMSKVLSMILTLVMFLSVSTPAFAWGNIGIGNGWDRDIGEDEVRDFDVDVEEGEEEYDYFSTFDEETGINVTVEAPMGALPTLAEVRVEPVDPEAVREAVDSVTEGEREILLAMDISFWLENDEIEPEEPVRVRIAAPELEGRSDLTVVHIPDEEEPESIDLITDENDLKFELGTNEICFESGDFSVYAVIGGSSNDKKLTVEFYESATATTPLSTQVLVLEQFDEEGEAPLIDPGVPTMTNTQSFEGWRIDNDNKNLDVNGLNAYIHEHYGSGENFVNDVATLNVYAMIYDVRYVVYHDQAGAVLRTQSFHVELDGNTVKPANVEISHPYVAFMEGQNFKGWTPEAYVNVLGDYPLYKDGVQSNLYMNDTDYDLSDTLQLYPYVQNGNWLVFDNYIDQDEDPTTASFTSPVFVAEGTVTVAPATPTRTGYEFKGWFREKSFTNRFIFGNTINEETRVYAKWEPKETTYQVVFWQQNASDPVDAVDTLPEGNPDGLVAKTYSFYKSDVRTATTGASVSLNIANSGTTADNRLGGNSTSSIGEMGFYFTYNGTKSDTTSVTVKGDGSTVLNVYYDRKVITYNFYGDLTTGYSSFNGNYYSSYYPHYGRLSNGNYVRLSNSSTVYSDGDYTSPSGKWYYGSNTSYTGTVYHLTFTQGTSTASSAELQFGSIQGLYGSTMDSFTWNANTNISGNDWPYCGQYLMWHNETTGRYQNRMFQYTTGEATTATTVNYFLNQYEVESNTRPYTCLGQDTSGNYTVELDADALKSSETVYFAGDEYFGYELTRYNKTTNNFNSATVWNGGQVSCSYDDIGSSGHAYFYYARNKWNLEFESNNTAVKTESVFFESSLSDYASYVPTNGPEGYYFDGWYADPGFDTPFNFNQEMPNNAVRIYAKWTQMRFRVVLDPTGGETGVQPSDIKFPGNQATTFRVDYGEKVQGSSINNAERQGYTLLGWYLDPQYTIPFNFEEPITDQIADMTYIDASDADRQGDDPWNISTETGNPVHYTDVGRANVRGKVMIYAHWRQDPDGVIGVNVRYDAVESTEHEGYFGADQTNTIWDDPNIYADQAQAYAQPASTPKEYNPALKFLYWEILDKNGNPTGRKAYPGQTWTVNFADAKEEQINTTGSVAEEPELITFDRGNLNIVRPGQAGLMAETMTVYAPVDTIETGVDYLIGVKASNGTTYLLMSYNPSTGTYYGSASMSGYTTDHLSYAIPAVLDENGYVTGVDSSSISGATLAHAEWIFNSTSNGKYSIQSGYNSNYYLRVGDDESTTNLNLYPASYSSGYGATWVWDSSTHRLSHYYSSNYYQLYLSMLSVGGVPTYFDVDNDTNYARTVQLYKKTTIEVGPTTYTVTFMDGYTNTKIADVTVEEGNAAVAPEAPDHSAQGMIFSGWDTAFDNVTSDLTVTAQYVDQSTLSYTVTFRYMNSAGEWVSTSQTVNHGQNATPPTLPTPPSGYTFNSWDKSYEGITSNLTINAVYKQVATHKYVVTLRAVYGRADAGSITHINWYSNIYDGYGNQIPDAITTTTYKDTDDLFPGGSIEQNPSRDNTPATFGYENSGAFGDHGYNLVYDNVEIPEGVLIPEKPYDIPGYTFKGWARIPTTENIADFSLNDADDEIYIKWVEDNATTHAGHYEARYDGNKLSQQYSLVGYWSGADQNTGYQFNQNGTLTVTFNTDAYVAVKEPGGDWYMIEGAYSAGATGTVLKKLSGEKLFVPANTEVTFTLTENKDGTLFLSYAEGAPTSNEEVWVPVTYVAANEEKPYHDMYAVWEGSFQIYHSGVAGGAVETVPINFNMKSAPFNLAGRVTALNNQNRANEPDKFLYGGYYLQGGFTAPDPVTAEGETEAKIPAYDGTNWTWTTAQTENGMSMTPKAGETYYIKEVPADKYLQPYFHYTYKKGDTNPIVTAWLISDIDDAMYKETGFVIVSADKTASVCSTLTVENRVGGATVLLKPETIFRSKGVTDGYLSYLEVISNYEQTLLHEGDQVLQYWVTPDGLIVTGIAQRSYAHLQDKSNVKDDIVNETVPSSIAVFQAPSSEP